MEASEYSRRPLVLVADDNADIRELLAMRLEPRGFDVCSAADGLTAWNMAQERLPDLALLDWVMPGIQGHELCVKLKSDPRTESIPVVMLTARGEQEDRQLGMDLGADAYIVKPFEFDELVATLRDLIETTVPRPPQDQAAS